MSYTKYTVWKINTSTSHKRWFEVGIYPSLSICFLTKGYCGEEDKECLSSLVGY